MSPFALSAKKKPLLSKFQHLVFNSMAQVGTQLILRIAAVSLKQRQKLRPLLAARVAPVIK